MPKLNIVCNIDSDNGKLNSPDFEDYRFEFSRHITVDTKDLTVFYYAVRAYFRRNLNESEKEQVLHKIKDRDLIRKIKRRKNISLEDIFPREYYVEGVEKVGTNKYKLLWGT